MSTGMLGGLAIGLILGMLIGGFVWWKVTERDVIGDLRVEEGEDGGNPLLYLAMKSDAYKRIHKGRYVSFYVQEDPPADP